MKLTTEEIEWMAQAFPRLRYDPSNNKITGKLRIVGAYDQESGGLKWGDIHEFRGANTYLSDSFEITIDLLVTDRYGWPRVYEVGDRCHEIAARNKCELTDLHLFSNGSCCLGLRLTKETGLSLQRLLTELIHPFFYRLAYVGLFGLEAARRDLWGEYSHGMEGELEYFSEMLSMASAAPKSSDLCPCGSGATYGNCHIHEVRAATRYQPK